MFDPEIGFTSDVIRDHQRFVGRTDLIRSCIQGLNSPMSLIAIYGRRGVGKSSLLRQVQQMALGDYILAKKAGIAHEVPGKPRTYLTVFYTCDSLIKGGEDLVKRLCNDQDEEDGLLRLLPNDGKEIIEFTRTKEASVGADLKVINWGAKGVEASKYAKVVPDDVIQTFRNFVSAIVSSQVKARMKRDGLLILLDEFDVIENKQWIGSLIKSLSSRDVKFAICGIGQDLHDLVEDHGSVERLLEQGAVHVKPMPQPEAIAVLDRAEELFKNELRFSEMIKENIASISQGYPYFIQMIGKACAAKASNSGEQIVDKEIFDAVLSDIKSGLAFPTLELSYKKAIGDSADRQLLLHILAEQPEESTVFNEDVGRVFLKQARKDAGEFDIEYVDQLLPRLVDRKFGPVLRSIPEGRGVYEFMNPVFRLYVKLRTL